MSGPLLGRRALVTGAGAGIGRATAQRLAADGASVAANDLQPGPDVDAPGDVSDEEAVQDVFAAAEARMGGPVDLLVNNAGVSAPFALEDMPLEEWGRVIGVNLTGPFLCSRELVRRLPGGRGPATIVNVSSVHEVIPWPGFTHYCASKGGLKLFGETIARELAPREIRVAAVAPGAILTPANRHLAENPAARTEQEEQIPLARLGEPEEIAAAIAWLAGPEASYVTGETLFVDGGMTLYPRFV